MFIHKPDNKIFNTQTPKNAKILEWICNGDVIPV